MGRQGVVGRWRLLGEHVARDAAEPAVRPRREYGVGSTSPPFPAACPVSASPVPPPGSLMPHTGPAGDDLRRAGIASLGM
jgi:hypothetical protein